METTINPNITVEEAPYSALEDWVAARDEQQRLEQEIKKIKAQIKEFEIPAQAEALSRLAGVNELVDVEPAVYPLVLAKAKIKTFQFNPLYKIQVSFTNTLLDDDELNEVRSALESEKDLVTKANEDEINVLLAEKALIESKIAKLQTNEVVKGLTKKLEDLKERLTLPTVKSMALKKAS